jgi:hypothetical protein
VHDARAVWVNPAGLENWRRASIHLDGGVSDPGAKGRLEQLTAGFETGGLSFGYQRDVFDSTHGDTYKVGVGASERHLAAGVAFALYRGDTKGSSWDIGTTYRTGPLALGAVIQNIGQPVVRGVPQHVTYVPALTLGDGSLIAFSALARLTADSSLGYAAGLRVATPGRASLGLIARIETDGSFHRTGWTFGVSIGAKDVLGVAASTARTGSDITTLDIYGLSTRTAGR